jgi:hypothetical protein
MFRMIFHDLVRNPKKLLSSENQEVRAKTEKRSGMRRCEGGFRFLLLLHQPNPTQSNPTQPNPTQQQPNPTVINENRPTTNDVERILVSQAVCLIILITTVSAVVRMVDQVEHDGFVH